MGEYPVQLTLYTDYSLRMLLYLGVMESATIAEVAERFQISRNHLVKVAHNLTRKGYVHAMRGRTGGIRLAMRPEDISIGQVVRDMEPHLNLVECFDSRSPWCVILPECILKNVLVQAEQAFLGVLNDHTLADLLQNKERLRPLLEARTSPPEEDKVNPKTKAPRPARLPPPA